MRTRPITIIAALALFVAGCADAGSPRIDPGPGGDEVPRALAVADRRCPAWDDPVVYSPPPGEQPEPDPGITTAAPAPDLPTGADPVDDLVTTNEEPRPGDGAAAIEAARQWAQREARDHFAGVWMDQDHEAAVIAFTDDVDAYAAQVRDRFGAGWWVVTADHTEAELDAAHADVISRMEGGVDGTPPGTIVGSGIDTRRGLVTVEVVGGDDVALGEHAAPLDHPAICFEILDPPPAYDSDGPVRTLATADGWRAGLDHPGYELLEIAYDRETAERAFADNVPEGLPHGDGDPWRDGLHADLDTVDWDREVIAVWSGGRSGSCPSWVDDVDLDHGTVLVRSASPSQGGCTADFNAFRTVLAIDRDRLPPVEALPLPLNHGSPESGEAIVYPAG